MPQETDAEARLETDAEARLDEPLDEPPKDLDEPVDEYEDLDAEEEEDDQEMPEDLELTQCNVRHYYYFRRNHFVHLYRLW